MVAFPGALKLLVRETALYQKAERLYYRGAEISQQLKKIIQIANKLPATIILGTAPNGNYIKIPKTHLKVSAESLLKASLSEEGGNSWLF